MQSSIDVVKNYKEVPVWTSAAGVSWRLRDAWVSPEDYDLVMQYRWHCSANGGIQSGIIDEYGGRYKFKMSRLIMKFPEGKIVHHKNGDNFDNRRENLEITNTRYNNCRTTKITKYGPNVSWNKNAFYFRICFHLGKNEKEAIEKAKRIRKILVENKLIDYGGSEI